MVAGCTTGGTGGFHANGPDTHTQQSIFTGYAMSVVWYVARTTGEAIKSDEMTKTTVA